MKINSRNSIIRKVKRYKTEIHNLKELNRILVEKHLKILNSTAEGLIIHHPKTGQILEVNTAILNMLGYSRNEILNKNIGELSNTAEGFNQEQALNKIAMASKSPQMFLWQALKKDGGIVWCEVSLTSTVLDGEQRVVAIARDISDRHSIEESLKESKKVLSNILNGFQDGISLLDKDLNIVRVNKKMEEMYAHNMPIIGKKCFVAYHNIHSPCKVCPTAKTLKSGKAATEIVDYVSSAGKTGWLELSSFPLFDDNGRVNGVVEHVKDISTRVLSELQLRDSEEKYRLIVEGQSDLIVKVDVDGRFLFVSPSYCETFGKTEQELLGKKFIPMVHPDDVEPTLLAMKSLYKPPYKAYIEQRALTAKGWCWLAWNDKAILDDNNNVKEIIGVGRDITERKEFEQALQTTKNELEAQNKEYQKLNEELTASYIKIQKINEELKISKLQAEKSDKLKSAFLANMSHEIRTPMNAILGFSSILKDDELTKKERNEYINLIQSKGQELHNLINDILDMASIEAGEVNIMPHPCNINELFDDLQHTFQDALQYRNKDKLIALEFKKKGEFNNTLIELDGFRLKQILTNLLNNAIKFTNEGIIEVAYEFKNDNHILLTVKDTGIGIPKSKQKIIFERFRQVNDNQYNSPGGTGLGLNIVKQLVAMMEGTVWLESVQAGSNTQEQKRNNIVTTFFINLPYVPVESAAKVKKDNNNVYPNFNGKTILVAEDDLSNMIYIESITKKVGLKVIKAEDGIEALAQFNQNSIDLVLMDIKMPRMDGLEATRLIKDMNKKIPIVAQTAYAMIGDKEKAIKAGCSDYLAKPIDEKEFISVLKKYL